MKTEQVYYWYCPACNMLEHQHAKSLSEACKNLKKHEKEMHKGKQVGTFGVKKS
jgi:hypothetical protein